MYVLRGKNEGFTLIELLIVVAIIGLLAAIAIPQFSLYRQKGYNSAALSDLKNAKFSQEALFSDNGTFGSSQSSVTMDALAAPAVAGNLVVGAMSPAPATAGGVAGAALVGLKSDLSVTGVGIAVSNGVALCANINNAASSSNAYVIFTKHNHGTRVFASEIASSEVMFVQNDTWSGTPLAANGAPAAGIPNPATLSPTLVNTLAGSGSPNTNWASL